MDKDQLKQEFISPTASYRGKPFWSWNGELRGEELVRQTNVMKQMGLGGFFMHSRSGLITEYLGDEWFRLTNEVADAAEKEGMEAWLYDEDRWPSGSAGGKVTVEEKYRMKSMYVYEMPIEKYTPADDTFALFVAKINGIDLWAYKEIDKNTDDIIKAVENAIDQLKDEAAEAPGEWKILRYAVVKDKCNSNYNGTTYIDTMSLEATKRFIELTHEEYARHCGERLGTSIKGIFTDEPHRGTCLSDKQEKDGVISCSICWTDDIFDEFKARYGYDACPILPELYYRFKGKKVARVKLNYIDLADNLFLERFAMPINDWCKAHNMIFTGHVLHEDSLMNQTITHGSLMRFYEYMGYPGIDCLSENNRCYWIVKQLSSATRQLGKKWLLSELYGCTGWQMNFKAHKAVGDWQVLFGINLRCHHLSWYTMEGQAKRDYPASILHQSPWYKDYPKVEDYFARFGVVISEGEPACDVLVLNPIESLWCQAYIGWSKWLYNNSADIEPYERRYAQLFHILAGNQIDFDYGEEQMMANMASVEQTENGDALLRVGKQSYRTVIVGNMLTIRSSTVKLLKAFKEKGGKVIFAGDVPAYVDAIPSDEPLNISKNAITVAYEENAIVSAVRATSAEYVSVTDADGNAVKDVFAQVRRNFGGDGYAIVLLNTDREHLKKNLTLTIKLPEEYKVEEWNFETGERMNAERIAKHCNGLNVIEFALEAAGTRCFVFTASQDETLSPIKIYENAGEELQITEGKLDFKLDEPNVCVLDWARWRWNDGELSKENDVLKIDRAVRDHIGIERRSGGMLQPWFAKAYDTKKYGKLQLEYEFDIETMPTGQIFIAGERPEFNKYQLNGVELHSNDINDFWIDECFKKMPIPQGVLKEGKNIVTVETSFMRTTNVEAIYLVGDFGVKLNGRRSTLVKLPTQIGFKNFEEYALPFYTGSITYRITPEMYKDKLNSNKGERIVLSPISHTGSCVKVTALGKTAVLGWDPYEADVTEAVKAGQPIELTIVGTRKNLFGPLHIVPALPPACGPDTFITEGEAWTDDYSFIDSGLRGIAFKVQKQK